MAQHPGTRRFLWILLAAAPLLAVTGLVCFRDAVLSAVVDRALAQRGLRCGPVSLHLPLALPPSLVVLGPSRCEVDEGPVEAVEFKEPLSIHLLGLQVGSLSCAAVEIDLRARGQRQVELNALGDVSRLAGLQRPALDLMFDAAALSGQPAPPVLVARALVRRAGKVIIGFQDLEVTTTEAGMTLSSPRATFEPAGVLGGGPLLVKATPTAVVATFAFSSRVEARIVLDHVDATRPSAEFSLAAPFANVQGDVPSEAAKVAGRGRGGR